MIRKKKDNSKLKTIMAVFIAVIMVSSIAGIMTSDSGNSVEYKDYEFDVVGNKLVTDFEGEQYSFYFSPQDVNNLNMSKLAVDRLRDAEMFYLVFDPSSENIDYLDSVRFEMSNQLANSEVFFVSGTVSESEEYELPVINCNNATEFVPVVYLKDSNRTGLFMEDGCIVAESTTKQGFIALGDAIMYIVLGIL